MQLHAADALLQTGLAYVWLYSACMVYLAGVTGEAGSCRKARS